MASWFLILLFLNFLFLLIYFYCKNQTHRKEFLYYSSGVLFFLQFFVYYAFFSENIILALITLCIMIWLDYTVIKMGKDW